MNSTFESPKRMSTFQHQIRNQVSILKSNLFKSNKLENQSWMRFWELKLLQKKNYGLNYASGGTNYIYIITPRTSSAYIAAKDAKAKVLR